MGMWCARFWIVHSGLWIVKKRGQLERMAIQSFRDLIVWKKAIDLAESVYRSTLDFPSDERFGLTSQMRRAAVSIPSNIAEGQARATRGESSNFSVTPMAHWRSLKRKFCSQPVSGISETTSASKWSVCWQKSAAC